MPRTSRRILISALSSTLALAASGATLACGQPHGAVPTGAVPPDCRLGALAGDWTTRDQANIRIADSRTRGFSMIAHERLADGKPGMVVYSHLRLSEPCVFVGQRHVDPNSRPLRASPPHPVTLRLDAATGELHDRDSGSATIYTWGAR